VQLTVGPDGNIWVTEFDSQLRRITPPGTTIMPSSGPSGVENVATVSGYDLVAGSTVSIGGIAAGYTFVGPTRIIPTVSPLPPGTLNDLKIVRPDGSMSIAPAAWLADFLDVPQSDIFHTAVEGIFRYGITGGCGGGNYCRDSAITRAQMAVFLVKAEHGGRHFVPPACTGVFPDVPCPSAFSNWIEVLAAEGITGGCGGGLYCPNDPVSRQQMAVFLLKAEHGSSYAPPACTGLFSDVPCPGSFTDWIEQLFAERITGGCSSGPLRYCPTSPVTRGQMAVFLSKMFRL
jgi:S-layer family protein